MAPSDDLDRIHKAVMAELHARPVTRPWWHDAVIMTVVTLGMAACISMLAMSHHPNRGDAAWWAVLCALLAVAVITCWSAFRPGDSRGTMQLIPVLAAGAVACMWLIDFRAPPRSLWSDADCALVELAVSILPGCFALAALRRFSYRPDSAWIAGIAAGTSGMLALHVTCPVGSAWHAMAFHVIPWAMVSALMVAMRARLSSSSAAP